MRKFSSAKVISNQGNTFLQSGFFGSQQEVKRQEIFSTGITVILRLLSTISMCRAL